MTRGSMPSTLPEPGRAAEDGQVDEYDDRDTVPMGEALRIVAHLVAEGVPPVDASWQVDR